MPTAKFVCESVQSYVGMQRICLKQTNTMMPGQRENDYTQSMPEGDIYITAQPGKGGYGYFEPGKMYDVKIEKV